MYAKTEDIFNYKLSDSVIKYICNILLNVYKQRIKILLTNYLTM